MLKVKDTLRATVNLTFDGRVIKAYHGPDASTRFANEVRVLQYLQKRGCHFVPRLLEADPERLRIITTNCGQRVEPRSFSPSWNSTGSGMRIRTCAT
jgi:hypothetical protein